uniref:Endophilin-B1 n=1 Tax=Hadrurus spadix TaxID=141984 RepID=A0A1W7RAL7_9SCOR
MDLGKKLTNNFTGVFTRAKQYTQEVLGTSEKTALDKSFEELVEKCEKTRISTEKILDKVETILQPNPNVRAEEFLLEKMEKKGQNRKSSFDILSEEFIEAASDLGIDLPYGNALLKTGKTFQNIARAEKEYVRTILLQYVQPLRKFLENDFKAIDKERKLLEIKRLDLDACKSKLKKMKTAETKAQAEQELRVAQAEFDRQFETARLLLDGVNTTHASHLRCLQHFAEFHNQYYSQCHQYMAELQRQLNALTFPEESTQEIRQWKFVKDRTEESITELSVKMNETLTGAIPQWNVSTLGNQKEIASASCLEIKPTE